MFPLYIASHSINEHNSIKEMKFYTSLTNTHNNELNIVLSILVNELPRSLSRVCMDV